MLMSVEFLAPGADCREAAQLSAWKEEAVEGSGLLVDEVCFPCALPQASSMAAFDTGIADVGGGTNPVSDLGFFIFCSIW